MRKFEKGFKILMVFVLMVFLTGCVRMNTNMNITKEDIQVTTIIALEDSFYESVTDGSEENLDELEQDGYTIEEYKQDGYTGYKITKRLGSLDELSGASKDDTVDITALFSGEVFDEKNLFANENDTYYAHFSIDTDGLTQDSTNEDFYNSLDEYDNTTDENTTDTEDEYTYDTEGNTDTTTDEDTSLYDDGTDTTDDSLGDFSDEDIDQLMSIFDLKFSVTLPSEAISNNATEVSEDKKTLTWDLTKTEDIEFSFKATNSIMNYILIGGGIVLALAIIIIIVVVSRNNKKKIQKFEAAFMNNPTQQNPFVMPNQPQNPNQNNTINQNNNLNQK